MHDYIASNTTLGLLLIMLDKAIAAAPRHPSGDDKVLRRAIPKPGTDRDIRREWDGHGTISRGGREEDLKVAFTTYMHIVWALHTASETFCREGEVTLEESRFRAITDAGYKLVIMAKPKLHAPEESEYLQSYVYSVRFDLIEG